MPPPPPTSLIAGGNENGFKSPKPSPKGILTMLIIATSAFNMFYWFMAPAALLLAASWYMLQRKKKGLTGEAAEREYFLEGKDSSIPHMNHPSFVMRIYIAISSFAVGTWFEFISFVLEGIVGINFTYAVVASKPATAESTAALEAAAKATEAVDTSFLTQRRVGGDKDATNTGSASSTTTSANNSFIDGCSPKSQKEFGLTRPITAVNAFMPPSKGKVNIILLNHRCRLDWMMLWPLMVRALGGDTVGNATTRGINAAAALKIIMKLDMAWIPLLGYCTQTARVLYLKRRWEEDEQNVKTFMRYLASDAGEQSNLLIFPEGTDFCPAAIERSNKYATENGKPFYNHVLHPRTTGLLAMKNAIGTDRIESIIDVTIAYADRRKGDRTNDVHLVGGMMPKEISFVVERFVLDDNKEAPTETGSDGTPAPARVPADDLGFKEWVEARWAQKEADMTKYYSRGGSYGWDMTRDIEAEQWTDGKGQKYDRFVVGGNVANSLFNTPNSTTNGHHVNGGKIGTFGCFFKNTIVGGGLFGGNGDTSSIWAFLIKPLLVFGIPSFFYGIYFPFLSPCWTGFILTHVWIIASTYFFIAFLQKKWKRSFDQVFLYSELSVPQQVLDAEKERTDNSTVPPAAPKASPALVSP